MVSEEPATENPPRRLVLLGASNLTRGMAHVLALGEQICGTGADVLAAIGHGRSYGMPSSIVARTLPGILQCGLWRDLAARPPRPLAALVTDVGNDLLYGVEPREIASWVAECLDRLGSLRARIVLTRLPICNVSRLTPRSYLFFRRLFFPSCRLSFTTVIDRALELDERVAALGAAGNVKVLDVKVLDHRPEWYSADPLHITFTQMGAAWSELLAPLLGDGCAFTRVRFSPAEWARLRTCVPEERWVLGMRQRRAQPSCRLRGGGALSLY